MTKKNANVALIFVFLHKIVQVRFSIHCHVLAIVVPKSVLSATSVCRPFAAWGLSWDTALKYYWLKDHKRMWLCQFLGFKILTTYYFAS